METMNLPRPSSIVAFERLYLASIAVTVLNFALFWSSKREAVMASAQIQAQPALAKLVMPIFFITVALVVLVSLLFWWLVARQGSVVGKWLVIVTESLGVLVQIPALLALLGGRANPVASVATELLATLLAVAGAAMLLRGDAQPWFARDADQPEPVA